MARPVLAVVVAAMLLLSGCAGLTGDNGDTSPEPVTDGNETTTNDTETETETPDASNLSSEDYAPGGGPDSIGETQTLRETTLTTLNETSYVVELDVAASSSDATSGTITVEKSATGKLLTIADTDNQETYTAWFGDEYMGVEETTSAGTTYTVTQSDAAGAGMLDGFGQIIVSEMVTMYGNAFEYEHVNAYQEDGMWVHEYESTSFNEDYDRASESTLTGGNITVTVREDGVVLGIEGQTEHERNGTVETQDTVYTLSNLGETDTEAPDWYTEELPFVSGELTNDDRVLELTHTGGPAIPESATTEVGVGFQYETVPGSLEQGDTVYVHATENDDGTLTVHVSETEPEVGSDAVNLSERTVSFSSTLEDPEVTVQLTYGVQF